MDVFRLKLNPLKTELIWLHSSRRNPTFLRKNIVLFGSPITPVNVVRNLGVILDENMTMSMLHACVETAVINFVRFVRSRGH